MIKKHNNNNNTNKASKGANSPSICTDTANPASVPSLYFQENWSHIVASVGFTTQSSMSQKLTHNNNKYNNNNKGTNNLPICADQANRVNKG